MQQPKQYDAPTLAIGTPYRENSIVAIARTASATKRLDAFFTTLHSARARALTRQLPMVGARLGSEFGRRAFDGVHARRIESVATWSELGHIAAVRLLGRNRPAWGRDLMYRVKARFDQAVARRIRREPPAVFVGMYGASLETFEALRQHGGTAVLNFVNSHPDEHNRYLSEFAGIHAEHHELIPRWVCERVEKELALANLVLVPSHFVERQLLQHRVDPKKIIVLPYGVDLRGFTPPETLDAGPKGKREPVPLECLYLGQISHRKGVRVLVEAARLCGRLPVHFRLVGPLVSPEVLLNLPDNVTYVGASLPSGVAETMRHADLFVLPSLEDSFGLVILEAMASGLPVVTTPHVGATELISDGHDGLVVPAGDANALAEAIHRLAADPELRLRLGTTARDTVEGAQDWQSYGASVLAAISRCRS